LHLSLLFSHNVVYDIHDRSHKFLLGFVVSRVDQRQIPLFEILVDALLVKVVGGVFGLAKAEKMTILSYLLQKQSVVSIGLFK
jgi:hypothetical protein